MDEKEYQKLIDQLRAEVHDLQAQLDALTKRMQAIEAKLPTSMTVEELWNKKGE